MIELIQQSMRLFSFSLVDNLPCATRYQHVDTHAVIYEHGYRLGLSSKDSGDLFLNNHIILKLHYHKETEYGHWGDELLEEDMNFSFLCSDQYRVVGFEVEPKSIDSKRIKVEADGSCAIENGESLQKISAQG